jgi:DNA (cytosine-5)-methyltransferase 1
MATLIDAKVGEHRGKPRIYVSGNQLAREGFNIGDTYSRTVNADKLKMTLNPNGKYVVSKKSTKGKLKPLIDIRLDELSDYAKNGRVRILIANRVILILRHFIDDRIVERLERVLTNMEKNDIRIGSFFHGGGVASKALHEGMESVGVKSKLAMAVEIEQAYLDSSLENNPELWDNRSLIINAGVESVRYHKGGIPQLDILEAGIPCTGASQSGISRLGLTFPEDHPSAGSNFFHFLQGLDASNPALVIIENVKGYLKTASTSIIRSVLSTLGYSIQEKLVEGEDYGAFENRERWIMIATTVGLEELINLEDIEKHKEMPPVNFYAIEDQEIDENMWSDYQYLKDKEIRDIAAKKGFRMQLISGDSKSCGVITRGYSKIRSTDPLRERKDGKLRLFTVSEHAKAKTIPVSVVAGLSNTIAHQVLGQSVIYNWFVALGKIIASGLQKTYQIQSILSDRSNFSLKLAS